jgi:hypothetical protein
MLNRWIASALLVAVLTIFVQPMPVSSAAPGPPGDTPLPCERHGAWYPSGTIYKQYFYGLQRPPDYIYYDIFRCVNGKWMYVGSSKDIP